MASQLPPTQRLAEYLPPPVTALSGRVIEMWTDYFTLGEELIDLITLCAEAAAVERGKNREPKARIASDLHNRVRAFSNPASSLPCSGSSRKLWPPSAHRRRCAR